MAAVRPQQWSAEADLEPQCENRRPAEPHVVTTGPRCVPPDRTPALWRLVSVFFEGVFDFFAGLLQVQVTRGRGKAVPHWHEVGRIAPVSSFLLPYLPILFALCRRQHLADWASNHTAGVPWTEKRQHIAERPSDDRE